MKWNKEIEEKDGGIEKDMEIQKSRRRDRKNKWRESGREREVK